MGEKIDPMEVIEKWDKKKHAFKAMSLETFVDAEKETAKVFWMLRAMLSFAKKAAEEKITTSDETETTESPFTMKITIHNHKEFVKVFFHILHDAVKELPKFYFLLDHLAEQTGKEEKEHFKNWD